MLCQALNNQDLTICGDGSQTRSFQYIDDLIEGFIRLMSANYNAPVNIGNPNEFTICQLAQKIIDITGAKSQLKFIEMQQDDPKRRKPDISLAKELLSWEPLVQLEDGLKRSLEYFSNFVA